MEGFDFGFLIRFEYLLFFRVLKIFIRFLFVWTRSHPIKKIEKGAGKFKNITNHEKWDFLRKMWFKVLISEGKLTRSLALLNHLSLFGRFLRKSNFYVLVFFCFIFSRSRFFPSTRQTALKWRDIKPPT